jgi:hypothetical protein
VEALEFEAESKHNEYRDKFEKIQKEQEDLQQKLVIMDRNNRLSNLKFFGVPLKFDDGISRHDSYSNSIMQVLQDAGITDIKAEDFCSIMKITPSGQPSFLLAKISSIKQKMKLYTQRTKLKNCTTKVYMNEDLTKDDGLIYKKARKDVKEGVLHSCWTLGGLVYGKSSPEGKPFQIKDI